MANGEVIIDVELNDKGVASEVDQIDSKLQGLGDSGQKASVGIGGMVKAIGGIAAVVGVMSLFGGALDSAISRVDTLNNADRVFKNMGFSAGETKNMMENLKGSIEGLPTPLNEAVKSVQLIASATGDLGKSEQIYSAMNNAILGFGGSSEDVKNSVLQLSQALANGKIDAETWNSLLDSQMGPTLRAMANEMGITMGELKSGLSDGSISVEQFENSLIKLNEKGGGGLASLQKIAQDATGGIGTSISNARTAVSRGLAGIITAINDGLKGAGLPSIGAIIAGIGTGLESALGVVASAIGPAIGLIANFVNMLRPIAPIIVGILGAFGMLTGIVAIMSLVTNAINIAKGAVVLFNLTLLANPFVLAAVAIAGLVAAFVYLYQTNEQVRNSLNLIWQAILSFVMPIIQTLVTFIMTGWGMLVAWWQANNQTILTTVQTVWGFLSGIVMGALTAVSGFVMSIFGMLVAWWQQNNQLILQTVQTVWNFLAPIVAAAIQLVVAQAQLGWNILKTVTQVAFFALVAVVKVAWALVTGAIKYAITLVGGIIRAGMQLINGDWSGAWQTIKNTGTALWNIIKSTAIAIFNALKAGLIGIFNALKAGLGAILNGIKAVFIAGWNLIKTTTIAVFNAIKSVVISAFNAVRNAITLGVNAAKLVVLTSFALMKNAIMTNLNMAKAIVVAVFNLIRNIITSSLNSARAIVSGVFSFISSFISTSSNAAKNAITNAFNAIPSVISSVFSRVTSAISSGMNQAISIVTGFLSTFREAGSNIVSSIADGISGAIGKVTGAIGKVTSAIRDFLPFSPAKRGALQDIMYPGITNSLAKNIEGGASKPIGAIDNVTKRIADKMDVGVNNRLRNATAGLNGVGPQISQAQQFEGSVMESNGGIISKLDEVGEIMKDIRAKDNSTYLDGKEIADNTNKHNGLDDTIRRGFDL